MKKIYKKKLQNLSKILGYIVCDHMEYSKNRGMCKDGISINNIGCLVCFALYRKKVRKIVE